MADTILIKGGRVYRHDGDTNQPGVADVLVDGDRIAAVGEDLDAHPGGEAAFGRVIDASGKLVLPGFVNAHYHSHDILLKGCFESLPLEMWVVQALPPSYPKRSLEEVRARTLLGAVECLRSGMTTVQDMLTLYPFDEAHVDCVLRAYEDVGIRCVFSLQVGDIPGIERVPFWKEEVPEAYHRYLGAAVEPGADDPLTRVRDQYARLRDFSPRITWALGPTSPEFCSPALLEGLAALSAEHDLPVLTHLYESRMMALAARMYLPEHGGSQVRYLQSVGLLGRRLGLAHSVWLLPGEIELLAEAGANVVLNPLSNLKTKSGVPPIRSYLDAGVPVALGCDNCSCGDSQNMFQAMKLFAGLAAVSDPEPGPPSAADTLAIATEGGARALGQDGEIGAIAPGMKADISIVDLTNPQFVPFNSAARQTVYAESGEGVDTVLVDGRVVMEGRRITTIDEAELRAAVEAVMPSLRRDLAQVVERTDAFAPDLLRAWRRSWSSDVGTNRYVGGT